jgi:hypothetical protein
MINVSKLYPAALTAAALALAACAYNGAPVAGSDCFSSTQWKGWSSPVDDVVYLRVGRDVWRVDLVPGSGRGLDSAGQFLVSEVRGSNRICTANDLELSIASPGGFRTPLFPRTLRKLSAEEVAALPPGSLP